MDRLGWYIIAAISAVINFLFFYFITSYFGAKDPFFIATILIAAVFIHELGHLIAYEVNRIPARMIFLLILGGTSPLSGDRSEIEKLPYNRQIIIVLSGVFGNFTLILASYFLFQLSFLTEMEFLTILNLNGILILWNLFPMWILDGKRFITLLFKNMEGLKSLNYAFSLIMGFSFFAFLMMIVFNKSTFIYLAIFSIGMHRQFKAARNNRSNPNDLETPKAIPESHQKWWAIIYLIMISTGLIITSLTQNWF